MDEPSQTKSTTDVLPVAEPNPIEQNVDSASLATGTPTPIIVPPAGDALPSGPYSDAEGNAHTEPQIPADNDHLGPADRVDDADVTNPLYVPDGPRPSDDEIVANGAAIAAASQAKDDADRAPAAPAEEPVPLEQLRVVSITADLVTLENGRTLPVYGFVDRNHHTCTIDTATTCVAGVNGDVFIPMRR